VSDTDGYEIVIAGSNGEAVVVVAGEIDLHARHALVEALAQAPADGQRLAIDLSQTTFIDSTTLKVLLEVWRSRTEAGMEVVIREPSPTVLRTFEIAGLAHVLPIDLADRPTF
jgi:anti-anti-sigma factor